VRYRSFKDISMLARQKSFLVIVMALLIWLIVINSEIVLMIIATSFVASGLVLHLLRMGRHHTASNPANS
jgi:multisubunit Na+/H+ antiporter MnhC subunit